MNPLSDGSDAKWRRILNGVGLLLLLVIVALFVAASVPQLAGADESYVVLSDSMSPTIKAGAVVFVSETPTDRIDPGETITFRRGDSTVTHRVTDVRSTEGGTSFQTQGDANEDPDPELVPESAVVGTVLFHVPMIGYVINFTDSSLGIIALIVIPAALLIALELRDLWRAAAEDDSEEDSIL